MLALAQPFEPVVMSKDTRWPSCRSLETARLDCGEMGEGRAAAFRGDETKALSVVEPLNGTVCHVLYFL